MTARNSRAEDVNHRKHIRPNPMEVSCCRVGRGALGISHGGIKLPGAMIFEMTHVRIVEAVELHSSREIDQGQKSKPMGELVQDGIQKVDRVRRPVVIEAVIPSQRREATSLANIAVKCGADIIFGCVEVRACKSIGERSRVPGAGQRRAREVAKDLNWPSRAEDAGIWSARERIEFSRDTNRDAADATRSPKIPR